MGMAVLTQDILAICLYHADGDLSMPLEELICRVERYQDRCQRYLGISREDFRGMFIALIYLELSMVNLDSEDVQFDGITLGDVAEKMLDYTDVYFNDEGEHWFQWTGSDGGDEDIWVVQNQRAYRYDWVSLQIRIRDKRRMKSFFQRHAAGDSSLETTRDFMEGMKLTESVFLHCSTGCP